ncbi:MAG: TonB-dependent receptor [Bacteroidales bacterium]|nr:TonB-dependent receptor [Candidatus Latescibacterota bacterium]
MFLVNRFLQVIVSILSIVLCVISASMAEAAVTGQVASETVVTDAVVTEPVATETVAAGAVVNVEPSFRKVSGRVVSRATGDPIKLAVINLFETGSMTLTGGDGRFEFEVPAARTNIHLAVTHVSYREIPFLEIRTDRTNDIELYLDVLLYEAPLIEVVAERRPLFPIVGQSVEMDVAKISGGALSQADPLYALKTLPQVSSASDFDGRFSIYGASPDANAFFLDGLLFSSPYHLGGLCSIYDASNIETFRFSAMPLSAASHGATGAVVEVESRTGSAGSQAGNISGYSSTGEMGGGDLSLDGKSSDEYPATNEFSIGLLSSSISSSRSMDGGDIVVSGMARRSYMDIIYDALGSAENTQLPNFYDLQGSIVKELEGRKYLKLGAMLSGDEMMMGTGNISTGYEGGDGYEGESMLSWYRRIGALSLTYAYREVEDSEWYGRAMIAWQPHRSNFDMSGNDYEAMGWYGGRGTVRIDAGRRFGDYTLATGVFSSLSMIEYELRFGRGFWLASRNENSAVRIDNDGFEFIADGHNKWTYTGIYGELKREGTRGGMQLGTRVEAFSRSRELSLSPRLSGHWMISDKTMVLTSWGIFARDPAEDFGNPAAIGNGLKTEKATQISLALRRELPFGITGQAGGYLRRDWDLMIESEPVTYTSGGRGRGKGIEVGLERRAGLFETVLSYSWTRAERIDDPHTLTFRPDPAAESVYNLAPAYDSPYWYSSPYERRHSISLEIKRHFSERFNVSVAWRANSGRPFTPIGEVYEREVGGYIASEGRRMSANLPYYSRIDLRAEWSWSRGTCFFEVLNATNHENVFNLRYSEDYSLKNWYKMIPIMPGFGVRMNF